MKWYTIREAAEATGTSKSTVRRYLEALQDAGRIPAGGIEHEQRAGHSVILLSAATLELVKEATTVQSTVDGAHQDTHQDAPDAPRSDARTDELVDALKDRIRAQEDQLKVQADQITSLTDALTRSQDALAAAQALHAATAEQLRLLTAGAHPEDQVGQEDQEAAGAGDQTAAGSGSERGPAAEGVDGGNQDAPPAAPSAAPEPEIPRKLSFRERLRILFTGE